MEADEDALEPLPKEHARQNTFRSILDETYPPEGGALLCQRELPCPNPLLPGVKEVEPPGRVLCAAGSNLKMLPELDMGAPPALPNTLETLGALIAFRHRWHGRTGDHC